METVGKKQFIIHSTDSNLLDTGISLKEGDLLKVDVVDPKQTGISDAASLQVNANGIVDTKKINHIHEGKGKATNFKFPFGSLIGTLDGGKTYFPVGTHLEMTILTPGSNMLSFVFWGAKSNLNVGSLIANVEVRKVFNYAAIDNDMFRDAKNFVIRAKENSAREGTPLNTGIELEPGDLLIVNVDPRALWSLTSDYSSWYVNANGVNDEGAMYEENKGWTKHFFRYTYGSLIGTLDEGKTYFPIGIHLEMVILSKGMLSFVFWDSHFDNNTGAVRAFVKVVRKGVTMQNNKNLNLAKT